MERDMPFEKAVIRSQDLERPSIPPTDSPDGASPSRSKEDLRNDQSKDYQLPTWRLTIVICSLCAGLYLSLMDITVASTALFTIANEFQNFGESNWILLAYSLSYVGCAVIFTRISEVFSRKAAVLVAFLMFTGFSLGCAWSQNLTQLIAFRALQGAGGSGLYTMTMVILPEISPVKLLPAISGIIGAVVAVAGVSGPIFGGLLSTYASWRWIFWINAPIGVVPIVLLFFVWPKDTHSQNVAAKTKLQDLDYLGTVLFIAGSVLLVSPLQQAGSRRWQWDSATTISLLVVSGCCWTVFFGWQWILSIHPRFQSLSPQFPFALATNRVMMSTLLSAFMTGFIFMLLVVNIPIRGDIVNVLSAVEAGIRLIPILAASALGSAIGGAASFERNNTFWTLNVASCFLIVGCGLMSTLTATLKTEPKQYGFEIILGLGIGMTLSTTTLITSLNTRFIHHAVAQGILSQLRVLGGTIGVAVSTIVLNREIEKDLSGVVTQSQLNNFFASPIEAYNWNIQDQMKVRIAETAAFNISMQICTGVAAACLILTLLTYQRRPPTMLERKRQLEDLYRQGAPVPMLAIA